MEGTQVDTKEGEILESWLRAEKAPEPGTSKFDELIKDKAVPEGVGMRYHSLQSAGWVYVYHTKTGDRSTINRNMLALQLKKRLPANEGGGYAFSLNPPKDKDGNIIKPVQGTIKCLLHKDNPNRELYDRMGLAVCPKDNITSEHSLIGHMKHRHKVEYEAIEKIRIDAEKAEDRKFQQALYSKITEGIQSSQPQPVVESQIKPQPIADNKPSGGKAMVKCDICGKEVAGKLALVGHKRSHK